MSEAIITVDNLGKKYSIRHQAEGKSYIALRDVIAQKAKGLFQKRKAKSKQRKTVEDFWALRDVSFEVKQGEVVGIIGRNGAGKSTLLKILSRITEPTEGRVRIRGRVASLLEVGTGFHAELTGRENIFLNGAILGMHRSEIKRKFDEIVAFAGVEQFLDTPVKRYSSGMYVRLAFAVAAHLEPEILIVDEVLAVGDAQFQKKCLGKMQDFSAKEGRTVLFVSHNMTAVKSLCRRVLLLETGQLKAEGNPDQMVKKYLGAGEKSALEITWNGPDDAPSNSKTWLRTVQLRTDTNEESDQIQTITPLRIVTEYYNSIPGAILGVTLVLYTAEDICVFISASKAAPREEGYHRATCFIPGGLLNDETYHVRIILVQDTPVALVDRYHLIDFQIHEATREGKWFGKWSGVVRPTLKWQMEYLNSHGS